MNKLQKDIETRGRAEKRKKLYNLYVFECQQANAKRDEDVRRAYEKYQNALKSLGEVSQLTQ